MRFRARDGSTVHLAYCTNVHPAGTATGVVEQLHRFAGPVREQLGLRRLGVGLWLSAGAAVEVEADPAPLRAALDDLGLEVVTLNGFPYGDFHAPSVKYAVYVPDWTTAERLTHTLRLARVLAGLLPPDVTHGTISTLPVAWRTPWDGELEAAADERLQELAAGLTRLAADTGKHVTLALEPEPGCVVETTVQAGALLARVGGPHVGACVDTAHLAVQFETPTSAIPALARQGQIAKAQVSAALRVPRPAGSRDRIATFAEPRFLHQVRTVVDGEVRGTDDVDEALGGALPDTAEWRVHCHVPLHADPAGTTAGDLEQALGVLVGGDTPLTQHLEVETYTWTVLPEGLRPTDDAGLVTGIARELDWTRERLQALGLEEIP